MRVLTVRQPWAWAIVHGSKDVENRTRNVAGAYRGPVAIHAGRTYDGDAARHDAMLAPRLAHARAGLGWGHTAPWATLGAVIGVVNLWAVHDARPRCCPNLGVPPFGGPWAMPDHWHLALANPRALAQPIPARGKLGLWRPDDALAEAIVDQLTPAAAPVSPDCVGGKCKACSGDAWDDDRDALTRCSHACHGGAA